VTKFYNSLQFRLTISFLFIILLISGFSYFYTYGAAKKAIKESVREQLMQAGDMVASQLTSDRLARLFAFKPGDEGNPDYLAFAKYIENFRAKTPDLANFYIMKKDGEKIVFLLDDLSISRPKDQAAIGEEYKDYDKVLLDAFNGKTAASKDFYTDKWGTFLSGYAPIKESRGKVIAVIGIDMLVTKALQKQNFIGSLIYFVMGISILAAALLIFFFSATIIKDINSLKNVANKLSQGNINVEIPEIKSKNEIKELSDAMKSVMAAVILLKDIAEKAEGSSANKGGGSHG
jgi:methyl-accepting chemotaxis protein